MRMSGASAPKSEEAQRWKPASSPRRSSSIRGTTPSIPDSLAGMRCLDVGTMDGFWALTMEKRGAAEVVALDLEDPNKLDWPTRYGVGMSRTMDETKGTRFELVRNALGTNVKR